MTDFAIRDQIKAMIANKMATFSNAMHEVSQAETEAIFADMSAKRAEYRAFELESAIAGMDRIKEDSSLINNFKAQLLSVYSFFRYMQTQVYIFRSNAQIQSLQAKIADIQEKKQEYQQQIDGKVRGESFKMLNWCINKMEKGTEKLEKELTKLDNQIASCDDEKEKQALLRKKAMMTQKLTSMEQLIEQGAEINTIKDDKEAMKALYNYAQKLYVVANPNKTLTEEQLREKIAGFKPEGNSTIDYFNSSIKIWEQFIADRKEVMNDSMLRKTLNNIGLFGKVLPIISPVTGLPLQAGLAAAEQFVQTSAENQEVAADESTVEGFKSTQEQAEKLNEAASNMANMVEEVQGSIQEEVQAANELTEEVMQELAEISLQIDESNTKLQENMLTDQKEAYAHFKNSFNDEINGHLISKDSAESRINEKKNQLNSLSYQLKQDKESLQQTNYKKSVNASQTEKEANQLKNAFQISPDNKEQLAKQVSNFVKENKNTDDETKVVLDKSLAMLYDYMAESFGNDRVIIDKRNGNRRDQVDRRAANENDNKNHESRSDVAGRRKGDRRQSNHVFISEETIYKLNLNS
jgi:predicted  nucleic acid-binding Zn-ribbon protein